MPVKLTTSPPRGPTHCTIVPTAWGYIALASCQSIITRLILPQPSRRDARQALANCCPDAIPQDDLFPALRRALIGYFQHEPASFNCRVDISWASDFARDILGACCAIAPGQTISYAQLARRAHRPAAARAAGNVMAKNPIPLLIPCHRVLTADGSLGGYSAPGGPALKKRLLQHESRDFPHRRSGRQPRHLFQPTP